MSKAFVSLLERDRVKPSAATLRHLAERLSIPFADLMHALDGQTAERALASLDRAGQIALSHERYAAARAAFAELRQLAAARGSVVGIAATVGLGEALVGLRRLPEAARLLREALEDARRVPDPLLECRALTGLGLAAHRHGRLNEAAELYRQALQLIPTLSKPAPVLYGTLLAYRSTMLFRLGRLEDSRAAALESLKLLEVHAPHRTAAVRMNLGMADYMAGDYRGAAEAYRHALRVAEQYEDLQTIFRLRKNLAMVLIEDGQPRAALEHLMLSVTMAGRLSDVAGECQALTELARCQLALRQVCAARGTAEQALGRSRAAGITDEAARASIVLGATSAVEQQPQRALRYLGEAYRHTVRARMTVEAIIAGHMLARLMSRWAKIADAVRLHDEVMGALRSLPAREAYGVLQMTKMFDEVLAPALEPPAARAGYAVAGGRADRR